MVVRFRARKSSPLADRRPAAPLRGPESLERRQVMTASVGIDAQGVLSIVGTPGNDMVEVGYVEAAKVVDGVLQTSTDTSSIAVRLQSDSGATVISKTFSAASVASVKYSGDGGNDFLANVTTKTSAWSTSANGSVSTSLMVGSPGYRVAGAANEVGIFRVGPTGQVGVDYLFRGAGYAGQLAIFSLKGMDAYKPGSVEYIQEACRRALSESSQGHVVIKVAEQGAKFSAALPWEGDMNRGTYKGVQTVSMNPGDTFATMIIPNGTVKNVAGLTTFPSDQRPLFSVPAANPYPAGAQFLGQAGDLTGQGSVFAFEDLRLDGSSDRDYNDIVFQVTGARGQATPVAEVTSASRNMAATGFFQEKVNPYTKAQVQADDVAMAAGRAKGGFVVDVSGKVSVTASGASKPGEVAIYSLQGMDYLKPGSAEFIHEAARRALTDSALGHIVVSDRFDTGIRGPRAMTPGDSFGVLSVDGGSIWGLFTGATSSGVHLSSDDKAEIRPDRSASTIDLDGRKVTVSVSGVNDNPPVFTSAAVARVDENTPVGTVIYTAVTTDADASAANKAVSYSIKPGVGDAALVTIDPASGKVTLRSVADFETKSSYAFTVVATNVGTDTTRVAEKQVLVSVTDLNDNAAVFTSAAAGRVDENTPAGAAIYTAVTTDADGTTANTAVTYSIKPGVGDAALVSIDPASGRVTLKSVTDAETKSSYAFTVLATNVGVDTTRVTERMVSVVVNDLNDNTPVFTSSSIGWVDDHAVAGTVVYTAATTDKDATAANRAVTYSIKPGVGDEAFVGIDPASGKVMLKAPTDYKTKAAYAFTVVATNVGTDGTRIAEQQVKVSVVGLGNLCAVVYLDAANNGKADPADPSIAGALVTLTGTDVAGRAVTRTVTTEADGCAEFVGVPAGVYRVSAADPGGRTLGAGSQVGSSGGKAADGAVSNIVLKPGDDARGYAIGRIAPAQLAGSVYNDRDADRVFDPSEPGIAGVTIALKGTDDKGAVVALTTKTGADGRYAFPGLRPGTYSLTETQPSGWVDGREAIGTFITQPHPLARNGVMGNDVFSTVKVQAGERGVNYNFGEYASTAVRPSFKEERVFKGTSGNDVVEVRLGANVNTVTINGVTQKIDASVATIVSFDGLGGNDTLMIYGLPGSERMTIAPNVATLQANGFRFEANGVGDVTFVGGAGDRAFLYDTKGNDTFTADPAKAVLVGTKYRAAASGVDRVYAYGTAGGTDKAVLTGSAGDDSFIATPVDARMVGTGYYNFVRGFDAVQGVAVAGGEDRAYLYDSAGNDTLTADPSSARLTGPGFDLLASRFPRVDAYATSGGFDRAALTGSAGDDRFYADPLGGQLTGKGFDNRAVGFEAIVGSGGAGQDRAYLTGTQGNDTLTASPTKARLVGPGLDVTADRFGWVSVSGGSCLGSDVANLTGSAGDDVIETTTTGIRLRGADYSIRVDDFTIANVIGSTGTNRKKLTGSPFQVVVQGTWVS